MLDRLLNRLRPHHSDHDQTRAAIARTEQIIARVEEQDPAVRSHLAAARRGLRENELAPKIRAALREGY